MPAVPRADGLPDHRWPRGATYSWTWSPLPSTSTDPILQSIWVREITPTVGDAESTARLRPSRGPRRWPRVPTTPARSPRGARAPRAWWPAHGAGVRSH